MKTGTLVVGMTGAGILGGVVGAFVFLTFFADSLAPRPAPAGPAPEAAEPQFSEDEAAALRRLPKRLEEVQAGLEALRKDRSAPRPPGPAAPAPGTPPSGESGSPEEQIRKNETSAIATLRNLASCQAQIQTSGKIDCDNDGIGEYGTFQEMSGAVGVRKGYYAGPPATGDFSTQGTRLNPPILSPAFATVDANGLVVRNGYVFQVLLPDAQSPAMFVHETGGGSPGLTGAVGVDLSETTWCAYAWPLERGRTGNRVFFVNQSGDVLQSRNEAARREGSGSSVEGSSAFRGFGITSPIAVGTHGNDGDVWKVTN